MSRLIITLTMVCVVAALVLGLIYQKTSPLIAAQQEKEKQEALNYVMPDADRFQKEILDEKEYYNAYKEDELLGYVIFASGDGYSGPIEMMVGIDTKGSITGIKILSQQETPGLGAKCIEVKYGEKEPWFMEQFKQKAKDELNLNNIQAITGATITTEAMIEAIKKAIEDFLKTK